MTSQRKIVLFLLPQVVNSVRCANLLCMDIEQHIPEEAEPEQPPKDTNDRGLIIALVVLALVAGLVSLATLFWFNSQAAAQPEAPAPLPVSTSEEVVGVAPLEEEEEDVILGEVGPEVVNANIPPYDRAAFGSDWADPDGNGCDARNDVLARDMTDPWIDGDGCEVLTGTLADDPWSSLAEVDFRRGGNGEEVPIDHILPVALAWELGAWEWTPEERVAFYNDPLNLVVTTNIPADKLGTTENASINGWKTDMGPAQLAACLKGDQATATALGVKDGDCAYPGNPEDFNQCLYADSFVAVAERYAFIVPQADVTALRNMLANC